MEKIKINKVIEYLAPTLVFSYFFIHNIFLVLIGMTFSFYLININMMNNLKKSIYKNLAVKNETEDFNKNEKKIISNTINIKSTKEDKKLTLVEEIEEFGFIPSIDKKKNSNAA
ncbi:hypothetical protein DNJ72_06720 [Prochlorococcus marinus XMU1403]|uniref:hypothetical protein n=1 Tax=Prochlorococcus marinus TaxID=1219 RepID=UPI000D942BA1|nr:hypothetical protein [Prochlorococcus marinus]MBW3049836.1 hypothetical protein [Prochlorococcus marinus str. MU1403]PYE00752.1 hypothetical protein DNJ72_06720 [Prochlorococcus marinus XMU1403]